MIDPAYLVKFKSYSNEDLIVGALICQELSSHKPKTILDIGAGTGIVSFSVASYFQNSPDITLIDEKTDYDDIYKTCSSATFINQRWQEYNSENKFDLVIMSHVIGDFPIEERQHLISKALKYLDKGGVLVSIENGPDQNFDSFVSKVFSNQGTEFNIDFSEIEDAANEYDFHSRDILTFLKIGENRAEAVFNSNIFFPKIFEPGEKDCIESLIDKRKAGPIYFIPINQRLYFISRPIDQ